MESKELNENRTLFLFTFVLILLEVLLPPYHMIDKGRLLLFLEREIKLAFDFKFVRSQSLHVPLGKKSCDNVIFQINRSD